MADGTHILNVRSPAARMRHAEAAYRRLFEQAPLPLVVLTCDLRIANANDAYLAATRRGRESVAGLDMFDAFPDSPHDPYATGVWNLRRSFERILRTGLPDVMKLQRYDVKPDGAPWEIRYWNPRNWALRGESGAILALVHHVADATAETFGARAAIPPDQPHTADVIARADAAVRMGRWNAEDARRDLQDIRARMAALRHGR